METDFGATTQRRPYHPEAFPQPMLMEIGRPYPFAGTVLMGALLNVAIFKLSPRTNAAHFVAIGVLGSLGVNSMHAILKLAGHTKDSFMMEMDGYGVEEMSHTFQSHDRDRSPTRPPQYASQSWTHHSRESMSPHITHPVDPRGEVYDSNIRFLHVLIVKPLSGLSEILIP